MFSWVILYMAINAMRLAAPSFAFGIAAASWFWQSEPGVYVPTPTKSYR